MMDNWFWNLKTGVNSNLWCSLVHLLDSKDSTSLCTLFHENVQLCLRIATQSCINSTTFIICRPSAEPIWRGQPTWRDVCQRSPAAQPHPGPDHRVGPAGDSALRHLPPAACLSRMCLQNLGQVQRNGIYPPRGHWGLQAQGNHSQSRQFHQGPQDERSRY